MVGDFPIAIYPTSPLTFPNHYTGYSHPFIFQTCVCFSHATEVLRWIVLHIQYIDELINCKQIELRSAALFPSTTLATRIFYFFYFELSFAFPSRQFLLFINVIDFNSLYKTYARKWGKNINYQKLPDSVDFTNHDFWPIFNFYLIYEIKYF